MIVCSCVVKIFKWWFVCINKSCWNALSQVIGEYFVYGFSIPQDIKSLSIEMDDTKWHHYSAIWSV